jgi:hypothetical protein
MTPDDADAPPREPTRDELWMLRYAHDEARYGSGGVLYVREDGECAYVQDLDGTFPEAFVDGLRDTMVTKSDLMFVVQRDAARLHVYAYPREAAALKLSTLTGADGSAVQESDAGGVENPSCGP